MKLLILTLTLSIGFHSLAENISGITCVAQSNVGPLNSDLSKEINLGKNSPRNINGVRYDRFMFSAGESAFFIMIGNDGSVRLTQDLSPSHLDPQSMNNSLTTTIQVGSSARLQTYTNETTVVINCTRQR